MKLSKTDLKNIAEALDIQRYRKKRDRQFTDRPYSKLVDKFYANKPVTLPEMREVCESPDSLWAYVDSLLKIFPAHAALALEGKRNGETLASGMVLAHMVTKATVFLPLPDFIYVFAVLARDVDDGGISFAQVARSAEAERHIQDGWSVIFRQWINDIVVSRDRTLDLAMHTAGMSLFSLGARLSQEPQADDKAKPSSSADIASVVTEALRGEHMVTNVRPPRSRSLKTLTTVA